LDCAGHRLRRSHNKRYLLRCTVWPM